MRKKKYPRIFNILPLLLPLLLSGCGSALMDPKGEIGNELKSLILTAFGLMLIVVIPVIVMTILFAWRYRHSNLMAKYAPEWSHSNAIEVVVWLIPCVIIVFLAILTWNTSHSLDPHKPIADKEDTLQIEAVSLDWKWLFIYPEQGIATVNELALPVDKPVHFRVTSGSVMNSFMVPTLGSQIYAMAGMDNDVYLVANEKGVYPGRSTNFSGEGFAEMTFDAHVTSEQDFQAWVDKVRGGSDTLSYPDGYRKLAEPTEDAPVQYFSSVSPDLYQDIIDSFRYGDGGHGEHAGEHGETPMSAEAAE
ncbi:MULTISPECIES: ubiquinol oxidase subunit II [unclassified Modicisalibacter]|uniref:ubiquinol oxidase subunit II n=1 Tax=unclassified Modicisalibacter TaxID=2679913 RepID=UPI001CC96390|nr:MULTISPECIES: ubiquinol oxidase subunit II [unclassified Modicisalibacter]MBZ9557693.1 ubiquinol oxidase subunit II [Modicisalibacter sp. R2A 31.J]MBZ9573643.1 ubiquinol oxidase subunit II [Modicisalibacter sp. MOD 31.J]